MKPLLTTINELFDDMRIQIDRDIVGGFNMSYSVGEEPEITTHLATRHDWLEWKSEHGYEIAEYRNGGVRFFFIFSEVVA